MAESRSLPKTLQSGMQRCHSCTEAIGKETSDRHAARCRARRSALVDCRLRLLMLVQNCETWERDFPNATSTCPAARSFRGRSPPALSFCKANRSHRWEDSWRELGCLDRLEFELVDLTVRRARLDRPEKSRGLHRFQALPQKATGRGEIDPTCLGIDRFFRPFWGSLAAGCL
jgi:hypothetical protein